MMKVITLPILLLFCMLTASAEAQWFKTANRTLKGQSGEPVMAAPENDPLENQPQPIDVAPESYSDAGSCGCDTCDDCQPACGRWLRHCRAKLHRCWDRCAGALNGCDDGCQTCEEVPACDACENPCRRHFGLFHGLFHHRGCGCEVADADCGCGSDLPQNYDGPTEVPVEQEVSPTPAVERSASKLSPWRIRLAAALGL